jgi:hypothetical protein
MQAQDMKTLFTQMPDILLPQLETAWRKDLADLYLNGKEARLQNIMEGYSRLLELTADYLLLQVTERSYVEMKTLPLINNTHILCVVTTVEGPAPDSRIAFYTTDWQPLEASGLFNPVKAEDFLVAANADNDAYLDAAALLDMDLIRYRLSPGDLTLTASLSTPAYLQRTNSARVEPFLRNQPIVFTWNKSSFR